MATKHAKLSCDHVYPPNGLAMHSKRNMGKAARQAASDPINASLALHERSRVCRVEISAMAFGIVVKQLPLKSREDRLFKARATKGSNRWKFPSANLKDLRFEKAGVLGGRQWCTCSHVKTQLLVLSPGEPCCRR
jgi:hypothetical protein